MKHTALRLSSALAMVAAGVAGVAATAAPSTAQAPAQTASRHVIVVLKSQHHVAPAAARSRTEQRAGQQSAYAANRAASTDVVANARANGASSVHTYGLIAGFSATMSPSAVAALSRNPAVAHVFPDKQISMGPSLKSQLADAAATGAGATTGSKAKVGPNVCPTNPADPILTPEALGVTHTAYSDPATPQAQNEVDGTGVKVAFIADGLDINNQDFIRSGGGHVFIDYQDFSGDGPNAKTGGGEAFGDASSIAAQGLHSYDLSTFVSHKYPLPAGCTITVRGMAPGASLIGLKVFGNSNFAPTSNFIDAIDYAVSDGANVLNESFGGNPFPDTGNDPITLADRAAIAAGTTVVASTGDSGTTGTVGSPATDPQVIGVAASTTFQSYAQDTEAGFQFSKGKWLNNNISGLSSGGTTQAARVPDLVAPGDSNWALCSTNQAFYTDCANDSGGPAPIQNFGGTSQSSPLTAGAAALVVQAYRSTHGGANPTPALVKRILTSTATDLGHPAYEQGSGLLNSLAAVRAAESWQDGNGSPTPVGKALVVDQTQLSAVGRPNATVTKQVSVTNVSSSTVTVKASTRQLGKPKTIAHGTAILNTKKAKKYVDNFGIPRSYVKRTFKVPGGHDRLDVTIANKLGDVYASRIILIDPKGAYAAYSLPQGASNWAHVDVRNPRKGTWKAYFAASTESKFNGPIRYAATVSNNKKANASLSASSFTLAPGASHTEVVKVHEPSTPSDVSASVQFAETGGPTTSVPLTARAIIAKRGSFKSSISGGNGRGAPALSKFYYVNVPKGAKSVNVGITFANPNQQVFTTLSDPSGQVASYQSNVKQKGKKLVLVKGIQLNQQHPVKGQWVVGIAVQNPANGASLKTPYTVKVSYSAAKVHAPGLPKGKKLAKGKVVKVPVKVTNTGTATQQYFVDPRLDQQGIVSLGDIDGTTYPFTLPQKNKVVPAWLAPTQCTSLTTTAAASQPVNLDTYYSSGNPEVYGGAVGNGASTTVTGGQVSPGVWLDDVGQVGPFAGKATPGTVTLTTAAQCKLFDLSTTTAAGDFWMEGATGQSGPLARSAKQSLSAPGVSRPAFLTGRASTRKAPTFLTLAPGKSGTIMVKIHPRGAKGTVVKGHLYVDNFDSYLLGGNEVAGLPYSYTVK